MIVYNICRCAAFLHLWRRASAKLLEESGTRSEEFIYDGDFLILFRKKPSIKGAKKRHVQKVPSAPDSVFSSNSTDGDVEKLPVMLHAFTQHYVACCMLHAALRCMLHAFEMLHAFKFASTALSPAFANKRSIYGIFIRAIQRQCCFQA